LLHEAFYFVKYINNLLESSCSWTLISSIGVTWRSLNTGPYCSVKQFKREEHPQRFREYSLLEFHLARRVFLMIGRLRNGKKNSIYFDVTLRIDDFTGKMGWKRRIFQYLKSLNYSENLTARLRYCSAK